MTDFINLTNGLNCCRPTNPHYVRIQSTWCEQKRWEDVLTNAGDDFLYHLATAPLVTVHDVSEKPRVTRALWQGLPWITFACRSLWGIEPGRVIVRGGVDATHYFTPILATLSRRTRRQIGYFAKFADGSIASVETCGRGRVERAA